MNYTITVSATSNASANTEDRFIEHLAAAGSGFWITRVKVYAGEAAADTLVRGRICTASDAGATGTSFTPAKKNAGGRAASGTCLIKNGANAFSVGTVTITHAKFVINGRGQYEWIPKEQDERIWIPAASYGILLLECSATADVQVAEMEISE